MIAMLMPYALILKEVLPALAKKGSQAMAVSVHLVSPCVCVCVCVCVCDSVCACE